MKHNPNCCIGWLTKKQWEEETGKRAKPVCYARIPATVRELQVPVRLFDRRHLVQIDRTSAADQAYEARALYQKFFP